MPNGTGDKVEKYLLEKRDEIMWALDHQGHTPAQIGRIFNIRHLSTVVRIIARKPARYVPKWKKVESASVDGANG